MLDMGLDIWQLSGNGGKDFSWTSGAASHHPTTPSHPIPDLLVVVILSVWPSSHGHTVTSLCGTKQAHEPHLLLQDFFLGCFKLFHNPFWPNPSHTHSAHHPLCPHSELSHLQMSLKCQLPTFLIKYNGHCYLPTLEKNNSAPAWGGGENAGQIR